MMTTMAKIPSTLTVDGKRYQIDCAINGLPQVWVHEHLSKPAVLYLTGSSLVEGTGRENAAYLRTIIRARLHNA